MEKLPENQQFEQKSGLTQRLDGFTEQETAWKKYNGGCPISADIDQTLKLLRENVKPRNEDLPSLVKASLETYLKEGQSIEQVWAEKVAEGANYVGILDGEFGFYKGEQKLPTNNKPMEFSVLPRIMRFREVEKDQVKERARLAREELIKKIKGQDENYV